MNHSKHEAALIALNTLREAGVNQGDDEDPDLLLALQALRRHAENAQMAEQEAKMRRAITEANAFKADIDEMLSQLREAAAINYRRLDGGTR